MAARDTVGNKIGIEKRNKCEKSCTLHAKLFILIRQKESAQVGKVW